MMNLGTFEIYPLTDGNMYLDGGAVFGVVPRVLWEKVCPPDSKNRIRLSLHCPLIVTGNYKILIDTGVGTKHNEKFCQMYGIEKKSHLLTSLNHFGYRPEDIDLVINTHLHFDHAGGNTTVNEKGKIVPMFPKARYFVQKGEMDAALNPNERTRASYLAEDFLPLDDHKLLSVVHEEIVEVDNGISLIKIGGHTRHHQCVKIESEGHVAFFLGDFIPTVAHLQYPYIAGYDLFPLDTLENKKKVLQQAFEEHWLLIFQHDPKVRMGYLKKTEGRFGIEEVTI
ncbi:MAG: MBL fold metallo-hydrolase [Candidatus Brocadia sp.]|nr:MBL fold metallo-hydrolase [Candidatus Brocadia sp.]MDG6025615.1 MBL fold metallo-hydrolase [Candidatus Brocadia sp.]